MSTKENPGLSAQTVTSVRLAPVTAEGLYAAYNAGGDPATANKNYRGEPCPAWGDLPENIRAKWQAAADCAAGSQAALASLIVLSGVVEGGGVGVRRWIEVGERGPVGAPIKMGTRVTVRIDEAAQGADGGGK